MLGVPRLLYVIVNVERNLSQSVYSEGLSTLCEVLGSVGAMWGEMQAVLPSEISPLHIYPLLSPSGTMNLLSVSIMSLLAGLLGCDLRRLVFTPILAALSLGSCRWLVASVLASAVLETLKDCSSQEYRDRTCALQPARVAV